jgi:ATP adenylyltransferase
MAYVGGASAGPGCVFCIASSGPDDRASLVLARGSHAFLILNAYPYTPGHVMAVTNRHIAALTDATPDELADLMALARTAVSALGVEYRAEGFNIGLNQGRVAGAGIADHLHVHVVPRWHGDVNFMSVVGEARVIPEALATTYERLKGRLVG